MNYRKNKLERLARVAHLYYEEDKTQGEIADIMGVSRPLISRMLNEARSLGIVEIRVHKPDCDAQTLLERLCRRYSLLGGMLVPDEQSADIVDYTIAKHMLDFIVRERPETLGIGWGRIITTAVGILERSPAQISAVRTVCPLIGNSNVADREYRSDENVRALAEAYSAQPVFLHAPAYYENEEDAAALRTTHQFRSVCAQWSRLDMALVGIHDSKIVAQTGYPIHRAAVGYAAGYGFDQQGKRILSATETITHIPYELLSGCRCVVGLCAAGTRAETVESILKSGIITHLFAEETLAEELLAEQDAYRDA